MPRISSQIGPTLRNELLGVRMSCCSPAQSGTSKLEPTWLKKSRLKPRVTPYVVQVKSSPLSTQFKMVSYASGSLVLMLPKTSTRKMAISRDVEQSSSLLLQLLLLRAFRKLMKNWRKVIYLFFILFVLLNF